MYTLYLSAFLVNGMLWTITLRNGQSGFEKSAAKHGADFVKSHPNVQEHDINEFCNNKYPIIIKEGKMSEIDTRLQTACILGAKEALGQDIE